MPNGRILHWYIKFKCKGVDCKEPEHIASYVGAGSIGTLMTPPLVPNFEFTCFGCGTHEAYTERDCHMVAEAVAPAPGSQFVF